MAEFKIGDKVKITGSIFSFKEPYVGKIYTINNIQPEWVDGRGPRYVMDDTSVGFIFYESELELIKPKFDIKDYPGKYVMHVTTEEEDKIFREYLHSVGKKWLDGQSCKDITYFGRYKGDTVYYFNKNTYGHFGNAVDYRILEFNDFDWSDFTMKKEFTKADLKNGDVVLWDDGDVQIVCVDTGTLISKDPGFDALECVSDDLTWSGILFEAKRPKIIAVRRPNEPGDCQFGAFKHEYGTLVYERKEVEEMTLEEVCKALGKEIKIVKK